MYVNKHGRLYSICRSQGSWLNVLSLLVWKRKISRFTNQSHGIVASQKGIHRAVVAQYKWIQNGSTGLWQTYWILLIRVHSKSWNFRKCHKEANISYLNDHFYGYETVLWGMGSRPRALTIKNEKMVSA